MAITVKCEGCGRILKVRDDAAGKRVKCPDCGQASLVAAQKDSSARAPRQGEELAPIRRPSLDEPTTRPADAAAHALGPVVLALACTVMAIVSFMPWMFFFFEAIGLYREYGLLHWGQQFVGVVFGILAVAAWVWSATRWTRCRRR